MTSSQGVGAAQVKRRMPFSSSLFITMWLADVASTSPPGRGLTLCTVRFAAVVLTASSSSGRSETELRSKLYSSLSRADTTGGAPCFHRITAVMDCDSLPLIPRPDKEKGSGLSPVIWPEWKSRLHRSSGGLKYNDTFPPVWRNSYPTTTNRRNNCNFLYGGTRDIHYRDGFAPRDL